MVTRTNTMLNDKILNTRRALFCIFEYHPQDTTALESAMKNTLGLQYHIHAL